MSALRIFSYLPNPRIAKATITARLCGVTLDVRGASVPELKHWLWDFDAHVMSDAERASLEHLLRTAKKGFTSTLYKTEAFLEAHPFGTVPAAFSPDGKVGIFESNSIMRAVARLGHDDAKLYGDDPYSASRIDSFLDASLLFARDTQIYVLALWSGSIAAEAHRSAEQAFATYMGGIERALQGPAGFLVGERLTLADICFVAEMTLFHNELPHADLLQGLALRPMLSAASRAEFPKAFAHFERLRAMDAIAPDIEPYLQALGKH
ncbi:glutathione S-transferase family protein [uncultured Nevskia sp.]|uniref:glutathione S-transferase family protein n=1 Tax=uncultured Nevskia sp. TaxID=228950 RepID=UPI0025F53F17|nr:glutathione S-transferase family protein [uncultured Nevskia sp.]